MVLVADGVRFITCAAVEDASASQARCTCYGRDTETREAHLSEKHNEVHDCCHGDSTVALSIIATQEYE